MDLKYENVIKVYGYVCDIPELSIDHEAHKLSFHILPCIGGESFPDLKGRLMDVSGTPYREFLMRCTIVSAEDANLLKRLAEKNLAPGDAIIIAGLLTYEPDMLIGQGYKRHNAYGIEAHALIKDRQEIVLPKRPHKSDGHGKDS